MSLIEVKNEGSHEGADRKTARDKVIFRQFSYTPADVDNESRFSSLQIEPLLQQAGALIDRVVAEDATYRQLRVDQYNLLLDLEQYLALDQINDDEVAAGLFKLSFYDSNGALQSDMAAETGQTAVQTYITAPTNPQRKLASLSAECGERPYYNPSGGSVNGDPLHTNGGYTFPPGWDNGSLGATDGRNLAASIAYQLADYSLNYQQLQVSATLAPITRRRDMVQKKTDYAAADEGFKWRRKQVAHTKLMDKLQATQTPNGPLNYDTRIDAIEKRASVDLKEAYARMRVVAHGIKVVYGREAPPVPSPPGDFSDQADALFLNSVIAWLRAVGLMLQNMAMRDQDYTLRVSLRALLGKEEFIRGRKRRHWIVPIRHERFENLRYIRLRGISATADYDCPPIYGLVAKPPRDTFMKHGEHVVPYIQELEAAWVGRITQNDSPRIPDIGGGKTLFNGCPIGEWEIHMAPGVSEEDEEELDDLQLNFHLSVQVHR